ncbi:unnamed protein product [Didymodactylos carnosus]|uniref:Uncharacterized protein n=1 Tax=Didymodactylos carnosus TaxID=1234261 RepID=A0A814SC54_9BILA|nr:unnamed protein product [Didymodactylos carnosus]CAF1145228.1 unnamed protein product [Didymodactylos carnosus]CAF3874050.1 unnamed protein product [Didymodactylos carnosus]CAF3908863.1 unnamed protein product [Didymodactylos carnosus]
MFKRKPRVPFDSFTPLVKLPKVSDYWVYVNQLKRQMHKAVQDKIHQEQQKMKIRYDNSRPNIHFHPGDLVWLHREGLNQNEIQIIGPYIISKQLGPQTFELEDSQGQHLRLAHSNQLKLFYSDEFD